VSVLCPMIVNTNIGTSERNRAAEYGGAVRAAPAGGTPPPAAGAVLDVDEVARLTVDAVVANRLYVLPHSGARGSIRRRFERIDATFDEQAVEGWAH
jgi:hypothetical protein